MEIDWDVDENIFRQILCEMSRKLDSIGVVHSWRMDESGKAVVDAFFDTKKAWNRKKKIFESFREAASGAAHAASHERRTLVEYPRRKVCSPPLAAAMLLSWEPPTQPATRSKSPFVGLARRAQGGGSAHGPVGQGCNAANIGADSLRKQRGRWAGLVGRVVRCSRFLSREFGQ